MFSKSANAWCSGEVVRVDEAAGTVKVAYFTSSGARLEKVLLVLSEDLERSKEAVTRNALRREERIANHPIGQAVWVRDSDDNQVPWLRGAVQGHDPASGEPLVRPAVGRLRQQAFDRKTGKLVNGLLWSAEESETARAWEHVRGSPPGFTMDNLTDFGSSWAAVVDGNDISDCGALASGALKLLFWLARQPALCFWVFFDAFPALEPMQRALGCVVAGREALYLLSVLTCTWVKPAFLLVDVGASVRDTGAAHWIGNPLIRGYSFLFMYVVAPEKFVAIALLGNGGLNKQDLYIPAVFALLDLCGLAALGAGVGAGNLAARARRGPRCRRARGAVHGRVGFGCTPQEGGAVRPWVLRCCSAACCRRSWCRSLSACRRRDESVKMVVHVCKKQNTQHPQSTPPSCAPPPSPLASPLSIGSASLPPTVLSSSSLPIRQPSISPQKFKTVETR